MEDGKIVAVRLRHPSYMLLYGAFVDKQYEFSTPDEMSDGREIVSQEEFIQQYEAGDKNLMRLATQAAWQKLKGLHNYTDSQNPNSRTLKSYTARLDYISA